MDAYSNLLIAALLVSLRIAPTLAFAPPFTLLRVPASARLILSLGLGLWLVLTHPEQTTARMASGIELVTATVAELFLGITMMLGLQLAFAAILTVGRALDIQVGFGLAQIADPTLRSHMSIIGMLFSYAAAAVFFSTNGPADLLAIWSRSVEAAPLGAYAPHGDLSPLLSYISAVFVLAVALASIVIVALFLIDLAIAFLSRTLPQMNVLMLGFQVKTIALLLTLPFVFAFMGAAFLRLVTMAIDATYGLV